MNCGVHKLYLNKAVIILKRYCFYIISQSHSILVEVFFQEAYNVSPYSETVPLHCTSWFYQFLDFVFPQPELHCKWKFLRCCLLSQHSFLPWNGPEASGHSSDWLKLSFAQCQDLSQHLLHFSYYR